MDWQSFIEFDGKPGTSATDVAATLVVGIMVAIIAATVFLITARAIDAQTDPAVPACEQAIAQGLYTAELYGQCLDDYRDSVAP